MSVAVLDTSALVALMLNEPGADVVEAHLEGAIISAVNLAEVGA
jgi:PIN domain nuclease of toxin-antitoxin system